MPRNGVSEARARILTEESEAPCSRMTGGRGPGAVWGQLCVGWAGGGAGVWKCHCRTWKTPAPPQTWRTSGVGDGGHSKAGVSRETASMLKQGGEGPGKQGVADARPWVPEDTSKCRVEGASGQPEGHGDRWEMRVPWSPVLWEDPQVQGHARGVGAVGGRRPQSGLLHRGPHSTGGHCLSSGSSGTGWVCLLSERVPHRALLSCPTVSHADLPLTSRATSTGEAGT